MLYPAPIKLTPCKIRNPFNKYVPSGINTHLLAVCAFVNAVVESATPVGSAPKSSTETNSDNFSF